MATFLLVHGAWHGSWCWDRLVPELAAAGHDSIVMDLPVEDPSASFEDYASVVVDAAAGAGAPDDVVVVGHSMASMVIPIVAARRPVSAMVFLCGVVPNFGGSPWDGAPRMDEEGVLAAVVSHEDGSSSWPTLAAATDAFYGDCRPEDAAWAFSQLRRQQSAPLWGRPYPLDSWPEGRRIAIVGRDDRAVRLEFSRHVSRTRLGVEPIELPGDHSPFLARPAELAKTLIAEV